MPSLAELGRQTLSQHGTTKPCMNPPDSRSASWCSKVGSTGHGGGGGEARPQQIAWVLGGSTHRPPRPPFSPPFHCVCCATVATLVRTAIAAHHIGFGHCHDEHKCRSVYFGCSRANRSQGAVQMKSVQAQLCSDAVKGNATQGHSRLRLRHTVMFYSLLLSYAKMAMQCPICTLARLPCLAMHALEKASSTSTAKCV